MYLVRFFRVFKFIVFWEKLGEVNFFIFIVLKMKRVVRSIFFFWYKIIL